MSGIAISPQEKDVFKIVFAIRQLMEGRSNATGSVTLTWASVPGKTYLVVCKGDLADPYWSDLSGPIEAVGATTSWTDEGASQSRWRIYCIVVS